MLGKILARRHGFHCNVLFSQDENGVIDPNNSSNVPGMHLIDDADLVIVQFRFRELPDEDMKHFVDHMQAGKPIIAIRTSTHAFNYTKNPESPYAKYSLGIETERSPDRHRRSDAFPARSTNYWDR